MNNLTLIGMPGAGKSTVGVVAAKLLGMDFVDVDLVIQQRQKRLLSEIMRQEGSRRFLEIEEEAVLSLECEGTVIAPGGSVIYSEKAMEHLRDMGELFICAFPMKN